MTTDRSRLALPGRIALRSHACMLAALLAAGMAALPLAAHGGEPSEKWPRSFMVYNSTAVDGGECVVGDATKEGMDGRAYVYLKDSKTRQPRWMTAIALSDDRWYQNRATHCIAMGGSLFVLVQTDTNQATSLSQTLLNVTELSPATGKIMGSQIVKVPGVTGFYSAWVGGDKEDFHEENGKIRISGQYFMMEDSETRMPFTLAITPGSAK